MPPCRTAADIITFTPAGRASCAERSSEGTLTMAELWQYDFMQRALAAALLVGCTAPLVGVLRRDGKAA